MNEQRDEEERVVFGLKLCKKHHKAVGLVLNTLLKLDMSYSD